MNENTLTARQAEILELIRGYIEEEGCPPTRAEIAATLGFRSANAAEDHLRALERKGYIEMIPGSSRGIRLLEEQEYGLPVVGRVAAGEPILAEQNIEDYCPLEGGAFHPRADYMLRVHGDSMQDIGIHDGDLLAATANAVLFFELFEQLRGTLDVCEQDGERTRWQVPLVFVGDRSIGHNTPPERIIAGL